MAKRKKAASRITRARTAAQGSKRSQAVQPDSARNLPQATAWLAHWPASEQAAEGLEGTSRPHAHITFIHGIANKPAAAELLQSWMNVLAEHGGIDLAELNISASMVYWADVLYAEPWVEMVYAGDPTESIAPMVPPPPWEQKLPLDQHVFVESLRAKLQTAEARALPDLAAEESASLGAEERIPLPWFLKRPLMERLLRDVHHYLFNVEFSPRPGETYHVRDEIRRRFVTALQGVQGRPHIVVAHSLGR